MSERQYPRPVAELIFRAIDDGAVIVKPDTGHMLALNGMGWALWQQIVAGRSINEMRQFVVQNYVVEGEQAAADVATFLDDLGERNLITWHQDRT